MITHEQLQGMSHEHKQQSLSSLTSIYLKITDIQRKDPQNYIQLVIAAHGRNFC